MTTPAASGRWTALVPLKALPSAKSRLAHALEPATHAALVRAMRADTLAAVCAAAAIGRVVLVVDRDTDLLPELRDDLGADARREFTVLVQDEPGLNAALAEAARFAAQRWPADGVVALVGDLPALTGGALDDVLAAASATARGVVADASGTGTTMLVAAAGTALEPQFGPGSAQRHGTTAVALPAADGARCDVDTADDLAGAARLGTGARTRAVLERLLPR